MVFGGFPLRGSLWSYGHPAPEREGAGGRRLHGERLQHRSRRSSELYDPASNTWSTTGSLNTARYYHTAVRLKTGKVLAIGGSTGTATTSCELYNPSTGTWSNAASTNVARFFNTTTLLPDGKVLVTGGATSRFP